MLISNHRPTRDDVYEQVPTAHYLAEQPAPPYFRGGYPLSLNLFSLHANLMAGITGDGSAPPLQLEQAIRAAERIGFDAVDVTAYYLPGFDGELPMRPPLPHRLSAEAVGDGARGIARLCAELGLAISGTGVRNDFAAPDEHARAADLATVRTWIDVAAELGAPVIRVFSGQIPADIDERGWETVTRDRIVPALRACAEYGATKNVKVAVQNHGDMLSTADQVIKTLRWVDHRNLGVVNDTGYFRPFGQTSPNGYDWYDDIEAVLPYSTNFQVKRRTAGSGGGAMDLDELFTRIRSSSYRGAIPFELVWDASAPDHPALLGGPPFGQIADFLGQVRAASERTKAAKP